MKKTFLYVLMMIFVSVSFLHAADNFYEIINEENASCSAYPKFGIAKSGAYTLADNSSDNILYSKSNNFYYGDITEILRYLYYSKPFLYRNYLYLFILSIKERTVYINDVFYLDIIPTMMVDDVHGDPVFGNFDVFTLNYIPENPEDYYKYIYDETISIDKNSFNVQKDSDIPVSVEVKAKKTGVAYIFVCSKLKGVDSSFICSACKVTVKDKEIKKITLDRNKLDLYTGQKKTLTATVNTEKEEIKWEKPIFNDNVEIGHMTERSAEIIGKKEGQAKITVTNKKNKAKDTCDVNVYQTYFVEKDTLGKYVSMRETLNVRKKTDKDEDKGYQLIPGFKKNNRYYPISNMKFTWTKIDKDNVLSLDKNTGKVKVIGTGKATVIAESEDGTRIEQTFECKNVYYEIRHGRGSGDYKMSDYDILKLYEVENNKKKEVKDVYLMWRSETKCVEFDGSHTYETQVLAAKPGTDTISVIGYRDNNKDIIEASISIEVDKLKYIIAAEEDMYPVVKFIFDLGIEATASIVSTVYGTGIAFVVTNWVDYICKKFNVKILHYSTVDANKMTEKQHLSALKLYFNGNGNIDSKKVNDINFKLENKEDKEYIHIGDEDTIHIDKFMANKKIKIIAYNNNGQGDITLNFTSPVPDIEIRHGGQNQYSTFNYKGDFEVNVGDERIYLAAFDKQSNNSDIIVPAEFSVFGDIYNIEIEQDNDRLSIKPLKEGTVLIFAKAKDDQSKSTMIKVNIHNNNPEPKLNKTNLTLTKGQSDTLKITVSPIKGTAIWSSSNSKVASVDKNGKVTGIKAGTATVTAKISGKTVKCKVTVKEPAVKVTGIKLSHKTVNISKGEIFALKAKGSPSNATDKKIYWESSNTKIVKVNAQGKIKGIKKGTAYIKVTTNDGGFSDVCKVTVK